VLMVRDDYLRTRLDCGSEVWRGSLLLDSAAAAAVGIWRVLLVEGVEVVPADLLSRW